MVSSAALFFGASVCVCTRLVSSVPVKRLICVTRDAPALERIYHIAIVSATAAAHSIAILYNCAIKTHYDIYKFHPAHLLNGD